MAEDGGGEAPLVQYVVVRADLYQREGWTAGSLMAQAAHAAVSIVWQTRGEQNTADYCEQTEGDMRKVVMEVKDEAALTKLADQLEGSGVAVSRWREQPENEVTCVATAPLRRTKDAMKLFRRARMCSALVAG